MIRAPAGPGLRAGLVSLTLLLAPLASLGADFKEFLGQYAGFATLETDQGPEQRNMSVEIRAQGKGFAVRWETMIHTAAGNTRRKSYDIRFVPSQREGIYASAMKTNVFGHEVPLDPLAGEPYVWARIQGATMTVHSLHIDEKGGFEIQRYDRTLVEDGLRLDFVTIRDGGRQKAVTTLLQRQ